MRNHWIWGLRGWIAEVTQENEEIGRKETRAPGPGRRGVGGERGWGGGSEEASPCRCSGCGGAAAAGVLPRQGEGRCLQGTPQSRPSPGRSRGLLFTHLLPWLPPGHRREGERREILCEGVRRERKMEDDLPRRHLHRRRHPPPVAPQWKTSARERRECVRQSDAKWRSSPGGWCLPSVSR
jgi:hypothetical protein